MIIVHVALERNIKDVALYIHNMTKEEFNEFVYEIIPQQLFHVDSTDMDDETGCKLDEVILIRLINENIQCLKYKPLSWFVETYL